MKNKKRYLLRHLPRHLPIVLIGVGLAITSCSDKLSDFDNLSAADKQAMNTIGLSIQAAQVAPLTIPTANISSQNIDYVLPQTDNFNSAVNGVFSGTFNYTDPNTSQSYQGAYTKTYHDPTGNAVITAEQNLDLRHIKTQTTKTVTTDTLTITSTIIDNLLIYKTTVSGKIQVIHENNALASVTVNRLADNAVFTAKNVTANLYLTSVFSVDAANRYIYSGTITYPFIFNNGTIYTGEFSGSYAESEKSTVTLNSPIIKGDTLLGTVELLQNNAIILKDSKGNIIQ